MKIVIFFSLLAFLATAPLVTTTSFITPSAAPFIYGAALAGAIGIPLIAAIKSIFFKKVDAIA